MGFGDARVAAEIRGNRVGDGLRHGAIGIEDGWALQ